mmetsp:Transcript_7029/g.17637  ORF Transcript_7029/g.17637 Transcript_7029/m.17637 type:complete len:783 (-) Transcript_7029:196-2544(-)
MKMNEGSEARGREIKSQRARELDELRSRGVAKTRREKLKDFSAPLQTAEEAQEFLLACRDQQHNKRESFGGSDTQPPNTSALDYTSFLMEQTRRQRELKMRRREAEQLLHGFRGFYKESFTSWLSPRNKVRQSFSFGYGDSLADPDDASRRSSFAVSTIQHSWDDDEARDDNPQNRRDRPQPNPLDPHCKDFLFNTRHYDGTGYPKTEQDVEVSSAVSIFSPTGSSVRNDWGDDNKEERMFSPRARHSWGGEIEFRDQEEEDKENPNFVPDARARESWEQAGQRFPPNPLDPKSKAFLNDGRQYDGTKYSRTDQNMDVSNGVNMFNHDGSMEGGGEYKTPQARQRPRNANSANRADVDYSPFQSSNLNFRADDDKEDRINVSASAQRLRQARSLEGRESYEEADPRQGKHAQVSGEMRNPPPAGVEILQAASRDDSTIYRQESISPRPETIWRYFISDDPDADFPPEAGRYHLYASYACPGSHRALIVRALKGLEDVISVTIVHPTWRHTNPNDPNDRHRGWIFGDPNGKPFHNTMGRGGPFPPAYPDNAPDPILNAYSVRNLYEHAEDTSGKYTIPLLWDTKLNTIVNNESSDISYMLNSSFNAFAKNPELDLYTEDDEDGLDRLNAVSKWLYPMMIHGVYRCGFAKTQRAYDQAIEELTEAFDAADELLQQQRYLTGDTLTDADIRFFVTLLRFDEVYAFYFRANTRLVLMTPSLLNFCREIYQMPGVAKTCQMDQIKAHFFGSHAEWNKYSVVPRGLGFMNYLNEPHDREKHSGNYGHI